MTAISDTTGDRIYWGELVTLDSDIELGEALQGAKNTLENMVQTHFGGDQEAEDRIMDYDQLVEKIGAILQDEYLSGKKGAADTEGNMDEEGLGELLEFHREMIDNAPSSEEEVAGTLSELATLHFENDRPDDAYDAIDECISIHEKHLKEWEGVSTRVALSKALVIRAKILLSENREAAIMEGAKRDLERAIELSESVTGYCAPMVKETAADAQDLLSELNE